MLSKRNLRTILISWGTAFTIISIIIICLSFLLKPIVIDYAISNAEGKLINIADNVVIDVLKENNITYNDISHISRDDNNNFKGIELDATIINILKSEISKRISSSISDDDIIKVGIPIGTLLSNEFFSGLGPKIHFYVQLYEGCKVSFENSFKASGINQTIHQVYLKIKLSGNVISLGKTKSFTTDSKIMVAQTVIVGDVPNSYVDFSK